MRFEHSAGAFIYRKSASKISILILKRSPNAYDLPKGHVEKGESNEQAALREIKEETGISAELFTYFSTGTKYFFTRNKEKVLKTVKFFIARAGADRVRLSKEHVGYEWCPMEQAASRLRYRDLVRILPEVAEYIKRHEEIEALNHEYAQLPKKSSRWELSRNFVPGEGPLNARLMLVGQAPGANEDIGLRPFIGRSGQLLDRLLKEAKLDRSSIYITSVVQFFPEKNREPTEQEISACRPFLERQISIIKPSHIVILGRVAAKTVLGIGSVLGNNGKIISRNGIKYMITLHPSAVLRFPKNTRIMRNDFRIIAQELKKG